MTKETYKVKKINDAVFDKFLKDNKAKQKFINACNDPKNEFCQEDVEITEGAKVPIDIIASSIIWDETKEGFEYWSHLNDKFYNESKLN